jgi:hypothetical protein
VDVDDLLSPSLQEKISYIGVLLKSFPQGETAIRKLLEMVLGSKRIERLTERIGDERIAERDCEVRAYEALTLTETLTGPRGVEPPEACAVMVDGGRHQRTDQNPDSKTHWYEYKAGICLELKGRRDGLPAGPDAADPCPQVPLFLLNLEQIETLTREIGHKAADVPEPEEEQGIDLEDIESAASLEELLSLAQARPAGPKSARELPLSPEIERREVVATIQNSREFGRMLAARAWHLGLPQAQRKTFVGDGQNWIWSLWEKHFKPYGFVPILDIIHAVTYLYAAALAGRPQSEGAGQYQQWVTWLWQGDVSRVIEALATRQTELGLPGLEDGETSPRQIVSDALTYLQNQQSRMRYPEYRRQGLPITSSHMESTIKELNQRIKGSEKFWSGTGGEAVLQLKSDSLSDSDPLQDFWQRRRTTRTGLHNCTGKRKPKPEQTVLA